MQKNWLNEFKTMTLFKPLSLCLGIKYTRAKSRNHFISFISWVSLLGIALGVMVLITVLSVMNGFDHEIKNRILNLVPEVTVSHYDGEISNWNNVLRPLLDQNKAITAQAPFVETEGMINTQGNPNFGIIKGIDPNLEPKVSPIANCLVSGSLNDLVPHEFKIILGQDLANNLGVDIGDTVTVIVPKTMLSAVGLLPRIKNFQVAGIFKTGYQFDNSYALVNIQDLQALLNLPSDQISGVQLKIKDLYQAPAITQKLNQSLPNDFHAIDWTDQNANFFAALRMEKVMMFLILLLIIAVAVFNMLSQLVMMVTDKQSDIAILRTLGADRSLLIKIFVIQGFLTGCAGTLLGTVLGIGLSLSITQIVNKIQAIFNIQFLSSNIYYIDFVPSYLKIQDVILVAICALLLSLLATIYPAIRAANIQPAEALRHE